MTYSVQPGEKYELLFISSDAEPVEIMNDGVYTAICANGRDVSVKVSLNGKELDTF